MLAGQNKHATFHYLIYHNPRNTKPFSTSALHLHPRNIDLIQKNSFRRKNEPRDVSSRNSKAFHSAVRKN